VTSRIVPAISVTSIQDPEQPPKTTRRKQQTEHPIMPPRPRLRNSVSMSSLAVKPVKQPDNTFCESDNLPPIQKLTKKSGFFKKFSSTFSLSSSTQLVTENGKDSTLKKKKKKSSLSETKVAIAEQEVDDCKQYKKSGKLKNLMQSFIRKS
jgi:hypothetical protein